MSQINPAVLELQRWAPVIDWLAFEGERVVSPTAAIGEMLKLIHVGHIGIAKCRNRAKEVMFWPNKHGQIEEMVSNCPTCLQFCISNAPKELMISHEFAEFRWQVVAADLFQINAEHYLLVLDYHSRYFEIEKMSSTTCREVIIRSDQQKPELVNPNMARVRRIQQQATQNLYYNRGAKQMQPLKVGDQEQIQTRNGRKTGSLPPGPTQVVLMREEKTGAIGHSLLIHQEDQRNNQIYPGSWTAWWWKSRASGR